MAARYVRQGVPISFGKRPVVVYAEGRTWIASLMMLLVQALMLAASVDCTEGLSLLIEHGATIELQVTTG